MKDDLKKLIASNQVEEAINQIRKTVKNADLLNDIIIIQNNWWYLQSKSRRGLVNLDEEAKFRNTIINNLLKIFDSYEITDLKTDNFKNSIPNEIKKVIRIPPYTPPQESEKPILNRIIDNYLNNKKKDSDNSEPKLQAFLLHLVEDNTLLKIEGPPSAEISYIARYIADYLFPHLKEQHFTWRLHYEGMKVIPSYYPLQVTNINEETIAYLTCQYQHSRFLPKEGSLTFNIGGDKLRVVSKISRKK